VAVVAFIDENRIRSAKMEVSRHLNRWHHRAESRRGRLQGELDAALKLAEELRPKDDRLPAATTSIIEVELRRGGLRFDLRGKGEPLNTFKQRVNAAEREDPRKGPRVEPDDDRWLLGPNRHLSGLAPLRCLVWTGHRTARARYALHQAGQRLVARSYRSRVRQQADTVFADRDAKGPERGCRSLHARQSGRRRSGGGNRDGDPTPARLN
jgi:hypothetical protein